MRETSCKVILVGQESVGKTSLIRQFVHSRFTDEYKSTIGIRIDKKVVEVGETQLTMLIWDLAGQITKESTPGSYFLKTDGVILVFDLTDPSSYRNISNIFAYLESKIPGVPRIIAANKADLMTSPEIDRVLEDLNLENEDIIITSAKTGLNVEFSFKKLADFVLKKREAIS